MKRGIWWKNRQTRLTSTNLFYHIYIYIDIFLVIEFNELRDDTSTKEIFRSFGNRRLEKFKANVTVLWNRSRWIYLLVRFSLWCCISVTSDGSRSYCIDFPSRFPRSEKALTESRHNVPSRYRTWPEKHNKTVKRIGQEASVGVSKFVYRGKYISFYEKQRWTSNCLPKWLNRTDFTVIFTPVSRSCDLKIHTNFLSKGGKLPSANCFLRLSEIHVAFSGHQLPKDTEWYTHTALENNMLISWFDQIPLYRSRWLQSLRARCRIRIRTGRRTIIRHRNVHGRQQICRKFDQMYSNRSERPTTTSVLRTIVILGYLINGNKLSLG